MGAGVVVAKQVNANNSSACVVGVRILPLTTVLRSCARDRERSLVPALASCCVSTTHGFNRSLPVADSCLMTAGVKNTKYPDALPSAGELLITFFGDLL